MAGDMGDTGMSFPADDYDLPYFAARNQDQDRPALWFYERLVRSWISPGKILDYGCGTGFLLRRLAKHYGVAGYDVSPHARNAAVRTVTGVTVYAHPGQIPQESFTGIVSVHVLEHIERSDLTGVLACWSRSLTAHGRVVCVVPDACGRGHSLSGSRWFGYGDPTHVTLLGWQQWSEIFTAAGFSVLRVGTDGLWCLPYRPGVGMIRDGLRYAIPTVAQFLAGRLLLPAGSGESAIFLLEKTR